jgi:predicted small metal-binding protein
MKQFHCGDVVAGCPAIFTATTETEVVRLVGVHATIDHGLTSLSDELVAAVWANLRAVAA